MRKPPFIRLFLLTAGILLLLTATLPVYAADPVVAEIDNEKITLSEFHQELEKLPPNLRQMAADKRIQKEFLDQRATSRLLYNEGISLGLTKDPTVKQQIEEATRKIVLAALLRKEVDNQIKPPSEEELKKYYQTHADEFRQQKQVHARHILVKDKATADKLEARLKKGEDFATLAKENSSCPSAAQGGDLGFFSHDRMVKEFADAAFKLKPGEISAPVKTKFGYHIIKVDEVKEASARPFAEVKANIRNKLMQEKKEQVFKEYVDGLKKKRKFVLHPEVLDNSK